MTDAAIRSLPDRASREGRARPDAVIFAVGLGLLAYAVFLLRRPDAWLSVDWIGAPSFFDTLYLRLPPTFPTAVLITALGVMAVARGLGPSAGAPTPATMDSVELGGAPRGLWGWLLAVAIFAFFLVLLEYTKQALPFVELAWITLVAWGTVLAWRCDRERGVDLRFGLRPREWLFLLLLTGAALVYWLRDAESWRYSMIGDEVGFYYDAEKFLATDWAKWNLFDSKGVFNDHPVFVTAVQALFLGAFGVNVTAWKASCAALAVIGLPWLYLYLSRRFGWIAGVTGCMVYVSSVLVTDWTKIGKPCAFMLAPLLLVLGFLWPGGRSSMLYAFLAGASAGLGFLLFVLGAMAGTAMVAVGLMVELFKADHRRLVLARIGAAVLGWLVVSLPILVQVDYFQHLFAKNLDRPELTLAPMLASTLHTAFAFMHFRAGEHFLVGEVVDAISALLILVGFGVALRRRLVAELGLYLICVLVVGTISFYPYPPITRLVLMAIPWAVLAGIGAEALAARAGAPRLVERAAFAVALTVLVALNALSFADDRKRLIDFHQVLVRHYQSGPPERTLIAVMPKGWNVEVDNGAYDYLHAKVKAIHQEDVLAEISRLVAAGDSRGLEVFVERTILLAPEATAMLVEQKIPVHRLERGPAASIPLEPLPLGADEIRSLTLALDSRAVKDDTLAPVEVRGKWDRAFIAAVSAMQEPLDRSAPLFPNLRRTLYRGASWESVAAIEAAADFALPKLAPDDEPAFSLLWDGVLVVERAGTYRFGVESDDGSFVVVDGQLLVDNLGTHPPLLETGEIALVAGPHSFAIGYYQAYGGSKFEAKIELLLDGSEPRSVPSTQLQQPANPAPPPTLRKNDEGAATTTIARDA